MKCARNKTTCARSVELFVDVHVVKRYAIVNVLCRPVVNVVIGVHIVVLSVPLVVYFVVLILLVVILYQFIPLFSRSHFSHLFSLYSHGILGVVFIETGTPNVATKASIWIPAEGDCTCPRSRYNSSAKLYGLGTRIWVAFAR